MSCYHENIVWQEADGSWGCGFFAEEPMHFSSNDPDYDPEWDQLFDTSRFMWATLGHSSKESAIRAWRGANPGTHTFLSWTPENAEEIQEYHRMARHFLYPAEREAWLDAKFARKKQEHLRNTKKSKEAAKTLLAGRTTPPLSHFVVEYANIYPDHRAISHGKMHGTLSAKGTWFMLGDRRIFNTETQRLGKGITSVTVMKQRGYSHWR